MNSELDRLIADIPASQQLQLIDPFLHPLIYDKTPVAFPQRPLRTIAPPTLSDIYTLSQRFCLLPTDVFVSTEGEANFLGYVNNLPLQHSTLYKLLETCITRLVPLFQHCLTDLHRMNVLKRRIPGHCQYKVWEEPDSPEHSDDEEAWASYERNMRHWVMNRPLELPDVPVSGYVGGLEARRHYVNLYGKRLQFVIQATDLRVVSLQFSSRELNEKLISNRQRKCLFLKDLPGMLKECAMNGLLHAGTTFPES
jgi:hypothetical protein